MINNDKNAYSKYTCPKCHGRTCIISEIRAGSLSKKILFRENDGRYRAVTCTLCGYTEFYSLKVIASQKSEVPAANETSTTAVEKVE